ncbi:MAG: type II toxin-antitoxin system HipA family toxin [Endomicrobium sp.]|jgi:serine/threonine-protein kinase HipA|nr:type II toxin-antitoxin system HipA family toxin [Endomicrobium sp.]
MQNKLINVFYHGNKVGRLAMTDTRCCAFEYDGTWLSNGFSISPFKLPIEKKVFIANLEPFDGNFGVFNDSLPDGWGKMLIDRMLIKKGVNPAQVSILDRLSIVGTNGMGGLEYKPETNLTTTPITTNDINKLAEEAHNMLNETTYTENALDDLLKLGGASGGTRPKVLLRINNESWLIKFYALSDPKNIGKQEYEYSITAKKCGINMPETCLFKNKYFGVKRFDRKPNGEKVFMVSASGLLETSHRYPTLDYVDLLNATLKLTKSYAEVEKMFRIMCFNVFTHNQDDHSKNFSFLYDNNSWIVSPAYDIVYAEGIGGEHATSINGEGKNPNETDIINVAEKVGLNLNRAKHILSTTKTHIYKSNIQKYFKR